jgi:hypothetical protein
VVFSSEKTDRIDTNGNQLNFTTHWQDPLNNGLSYGNVQLCPDDRSAIAIALSSSGNSFCGKIDLATNTLRWGGQNFTPRSMYPQVIEGDSVYFVTYRGNATTYLDLYSPSGILTRSLLVNRSPILGMSIRGLVYLGNGEVVLGGDGPVQVGRSQQNQIILAKFSNFGVPYDPGHIDPTYYLPQESPESLKLSLFPNPTTDFIRLVGPFDSGDLVVTNSVGQVVLSQRVTNAEIIDVSGLVSGYYRWTLKTGKKVGRGALVKH